MSYFLLALLAATCFALSQILNKVLSKHSIDNPNSLVVYLSLATFVFGLVILPFAGLALPSFSQLLILFLMASTFWLGLYCFCQGIYTADASSVAPLFQVQAAIVGVLAFIFLGERFPTMNYVWMVLLLAGAILVSLDEKMSWKSFLQRGIIFILVMQVLHATSNLFVGLALESFAPAQILVWENLFVGVFGLVFYIWKKPPINYKFAQVSPMFVSAFITGIGVLALFQAFTQNITISSVIGLLSAPIVFIITVIAARFSPDFLEHHPSRVYIVRGIGLVVILVGAYQIAIS